MKKVVFLGTALKQYPLKNPKLLFVNEFLGLATVLLEFRFSEKLQNYID